MMRFSSVYKTAGVDKMSDREHAKWFLSLSPEGRKLVSEARDLEWELAAIQGKGR